MATFQWGPPWRGLRMQVRLPTNSCWLSIDDCWTCEQLRQSTVQFTAQTATHQWICSLQHARPQRTEENGIYLYATINMKRNLSWMYCTIEDTDRHEASRGLSATAGLLVTMFRWLVVPLSRRPVSKWTRPQGGRGYYAYAIAEASNDRARS